MYGSVSREQERSGWQILTPDDSHLYAECICCGDGINREKIVTHLVRPNECGRTRIVVRTFGHQSVSGKNLLIADRSWRIVQRTEAGDIAHEAERRPVSEVLGGERFA